MDNDDGWVWVTGPAVELMCQLNTWQEGDEVQVDIPRWVKETGYGHLNLSPIGVLLSHNNGESWVVRPKGTGDRWLTAMNYIIAWRRPHGRQSKVG